MNFTSTLPPADLDLQCLRRLQAEFVRRRNVFIPGAVMESLLKLYGATDQGLAELSTSCDHCGEDPTLAFRRSMTTRLALNLEEREAHRLERSGFVLDATDGFNRHDSGNIRHFSETPSSVVENDAFQALMNFKADMMRTVPARHRNKCDNSSKKWMMTAFHLRTTTSKDLLGEPAAEGVHMDGVEYTMTTMLRNSNMSQDSAISRLHSLNQANGVPWSQADPALVTGTCQHTRFLDTLLFIDNEMQHSVSEVHQIDVEKTAERDMMVLFTRRPALLGGGHPSDGFDSMMLHPELSAAWSLPTIVLPSRL